MSLQYVLVFEVKHTQFNMDSQAKYIDDIVTENNLLKQENNNLKKELAETKIQLFNLQKKICAGLSWDCDVNLQTKLERSKCTKQLRFENHKNKLGEDTLKKLRQLSDSKQKDSTFVLKCMKKIYDVDYLTKMSADGQKKNMLEKKVIDELFVQRLANLPTEIEFEEVNNRYQRLNSLITYAINNILRVSLFGCY